LPSNFMKDGMKSGIRQENHHLFSNIASKIWKGSNCFSRRPTCVACSQTDSSSSSPHARTVHSGRQISDDLKHKMIRLKGPDDRIFRHRAIQPSEDSKRVYCSDYHSVSRMIKRHVTSARQSAIHLNLERPSVRIHGISFHSIPPHNFNLHFQVARIIRILLQCWK
jgi:hypothetical protein